MSFPDFAGRLAQARERIAAAAQRAGRRADEVTLIAVTKGHDISALRTALDHGLTELGENRVQEALPKLDALDAPAAHVHLIGQLQTNKVNKVVGRFASVMGVDRMELLERLTARAQQLQVTQPVWIQVNCSGEDQKGGASPDLAPGLIGSVTGPLRLEGLMTLGRAAATGPELRASFALLRELRDRHCPNKALSMGMSGDFEVAIEEGSTHVRLGTTLFGERTAGP